MLSAMAQCYLPGKMADNMHSHEKSDHPASSPLSTLLPPQLLLLFDSFISGFTSLSLELTFGGVSGCFWLSKLSKKRKLADFVPLCCVFSLPLDKYWCYLTQFYLHSHIWASNALSVPFLAVSQEMIQDKMDLVHQSCEIFAANHLPFPDNST